MFNHHFNLLEAAEALKRQHTQLLQRKQELQQSKAT